MSRIVILSAVRTAIGKFGGALKDISAAELGAIVIKESMARINLQPGCVNEVIMGNVLQAGQGQNPARQALIKAGLPYEAPGLTINMVCGSGLKALDMAMDRINNGAADIVMAGGMENMSRAPFAVFNNRWGKKLGDDRFCDLLLQDGLMDAFNGYHMGITAENIAEKYNISREEQDIFAEQSQKKTALAMKERKFKDEIAPVKVPDKKTGEQIFDTDEFPRPETTLAALGKLPPAFKRNGTVTAGNSSGINDAAAALILASEEKAAQHGIKPLALIRAIASCGIDPGYMGLGPIAAIKKVARQTGIAVDEIDLYEINEAFAASSIACIRELGLDVKKVNVNGGAISLGHPIGAGGPRLPVSLLYEMKKRNCRYGAAALCVGGGMGIAALLENLS